MSELGNHLWQSTLFTALVAAVCFALRKNRARTRYWLWLAASAKFLAPFSLLMTFGSRLDIPRQAPVMPALRVVQISTSFAPMPAAHAQTISWLPILTALWIAGALLFAVRWIRHWWTLRSIEKKGSRLKIDFPIPAVVSSSAIEPGVFGFVRPVLLLPEGLTDNLAPEQLQTILAHELCHVKSRDNLTAALHLTVTTIFWFHPAVWWIGRRLIEERERACDEAVLGQGSRPETYAQGILSICKFYRESPLACASGVTGADLKKRIREIMTRRVSYRLTFARKSLLAAIAAGAVCIPVAIGFLRAQTLPPPPAYTYEVVSIKRSAGDALNSRLSPGPQGGIRTQATTVGWLMSFAYDARAYQIVGGPSWIASDRFDVTFTPDKPEAGPSPSMSQAQMQNQFNRQRQRMQAVLRDRFGLVLRAESREMPIYSLTTARGGHRLADPSDKNAPPHMLTSPNEVAGKRVPLKMLTDSLSNLLNRYVRDDTGLTGDYDFQMKWTPDTRIPRPDDPAPGADEAGPSIFTAITEQLGLKLEPKRGPVPVFVVEKIERPAEN
jgi:uncharacterized protein (TIGR03435 family)